MSTELNWKFILVASFIGSVVAISIALDPVKSQRVSDAFHGRQPAPPAPHWRELPVATKGKCQRAWPDVGTPAQVVLASCWRKPDHISRWTGASGVHETWSYLDYKVYMSFDNGALTWTSEY